MRSSSSKSNKDSSSINSDNLDIILKCLKPNL